MSLNSHYLVLFKNPRGKLQVLTLAKQQELLRYLKQQNLSSDPLLLAMQRLQSGMDGPLSPRDLGEDEKAKQFLQLQNRYLTFKQQLNAPLLARKLNKLNKPNKLNKVFYEQIGVNY